MTGKRIFKDRRRNTGRRDARLIVIAAEGSETERIYFNELACFELWLLLHVKATEEYSTSEMDLISNNAKFNESRTWLEKVLSTLLKGYNKNSFDAAALIPHVGVAIQRARKMDTIPDHRWPHQPATRVYLLVESIINGQAML